jgi:uncharacterized protein (TIGR01777 family)
MALQPQSSASLTVAVSGSSGLLGTALCAYLKSKGHVVKKLVRHRPASNANEIYWNPDSGHIETHGLDGAHVVVHLAGKNIAESRWTNAQKKAILDSRVKGTKLISHALTRLKKPPFLFISASATGFYGDREDEEITENSKPGTGFLAEVCRQWEAATAEAERANIPVIHLRLGMLMSPLGGALAKLLPFFRWGLGGFVGSGKQYMSWVSIHDAVRAIEHLIVTHNIEGPVNLVSPNPVTNKEFSTALGVALKRPHAIMVPDFAVRLTFGQMGKEMLLGSCKVYPHKLLQSGYNFEHAHIDEAFAAFFKPSS